MVENPSRRTFLTTSAAGLAGMAFLPSTLPAGLATGGPVRSLIWIHMAGAPSTLDLFDPKPVLSRMDGKSIGIPSSDLCFGRPGTLMASPYAFRRCGESGAWVSELLPCFAECVDEVFFIRSCCTGSRSHAAGLLRALRSLSPEVVLADAGFPGSASTERFLPVWGEGSGDPPSAWERKTYGLDSEITCPFGQQLLTARRLVERGAESILVINTGRSDRSTWDAHRDVDGGHRLRCAETDLPVAGLLRDLKARGMLAGTRVVWAGEFGRMPVRQGTRGRDHNPHGFTVWMAGGGVRGGESFGDTDEIGYRAVDRPVSVESLAGNRIQNSELRITK